MCKPLLSICIPTYDRAELLRSALLSLAPQVKEMADEVEVIISDNCSTDSSKGAVDWAQEYCSIRAALLRLPRKAIKQLSLKE